MTTKTALHQSVRLPKRLADAFDDYYQTSAFAQANFIKFNKSLVLAKLNRLCARYGYTLDEAFATSDKFKGTFKISGGKRKHRDLRVNRSTVAAGAAEDWSA